MINEARSYLPSYLVGLIHGLAGSGVLMLAVMGLGLALPALF